MSNPIRVLQVVTTMGMGGIENFLMNQYRNIDRSKIQFDFLKHRDSKDCFDDEITALGGRIFHVPPINPLHQIEYDRALTAFFRAHPEYRIVHSHINTYSAFPLRIAKKCGVPVRIAHAHAIGTGTLDLRAPVRAFCRHTLPRYYTDAFACSEGAGKWLYQGGPFEFFPNGIDAEQYRFDRQVRLQVRDELQICDRYAIGVVASFNPIKNHKFLIELLPELQKSIPNVVLVLAGDGPLKEALIRQVQELNLQDSVKFLGIRKDINRILQGVDLFALPSISEGFPVSVLEAESTGLPCILSCGVPRDVKVLDDMQTVFCDVEDPEEWISRIVEARDQMKRGSCTEQIKASIYDVHNSAKMLADFYESEYDKAGR